MIDGKARAFCKALSWRLIASCVLATIAWVLIGDLKTVGFVTLIYNIIQVVVYFIHERIWNYIIGGRRKDYLFR